MSDATSTKPRLVPRPPVPLAVQVDAAYARLSAEYDEILWRWNDPRPGDGDRLLELLPLIGIPWDDARAHMACAEFQRTGKKD